VKIVDQLGVPAGAGEVRHEALDLDEIEAAERQPLATRNGMQQHVDRTTHVGRA
jgi:hypothetical protein